MYTDIHNHAYVLLQHKSKSYGIMMHPLYTYKPILSNNQLILLQNSKEYIHHWLRPWENRAGGIQSLGNIELTPIIQLEQYVTLYLRKSDKSQFGTMPI